MSSDLTTRPPNWQIAIVALVLVGIACAALFVTWKETRPIAIPDVTAEKFACASYTPSHDGHARGSAATRALVADDLKILAQRFRCIRTYSVSEGLDDVPSIARGLGLKVMLGLWISSDGPSNDAEIARGIALANQHQDVVSAVIVGNEVLLRRELQASQLRSLIERVRTATNVPVTYADVWEFWLRNPQLADVTSFVTVHILPYWEDQPVGIDHALEHVQNIYAKVRAELPGKEVLIGETGWPSEGRPRREATPSLENEARFIREFVAWAEKNSVPYNLIEAFDQPWKRIQEGTVGGFWGLYDSSGRPKFAFHGPVTDKRGARVSIFAALLGALAFSAMGWTMKWSPGWRGFTLLGLAGAVGGYAAVAQWNYALAANRSQLEWIATTTWAGCGWLAYAGISRLLAVWIEGRATLMRPMSASAVVRSWGGRAHDSLSSFERWAQVLGLLRFLELLGLTYVCLALAYDGRGRDFPLALVGLPIVAFMLLEVAVARSAARPPMENEERLLSVAVVLASAVVAWNETLQNTRAIAWCGLCVLFVLTLVIGQRRALHPDQRAQQKAGTAQFERI